MSASSARLPSETSAKSAISGRELVDRIRVLTQTRTAPSGC